MPSNLITLIFGRDGEVFIPVCETLIASLPEYRYRIMDNQKFLSIFRRTPHEGNRIYWFEILTRAHIASVTSILRSRRWIDGILLSYQNKNFHCFCATLRGFIEAAADTHDALVRVPKTLADDYARINLALKGKMKQEIVVNRELEDILIHYTHATTSKKKEDHLPASHKAKRSRHYISGLGRDVSEEINKCYSELCESTHPAVSSVYCFLRPVDLAGENFSLCKDGDMNAIRGICDRYGSMMPTLFQYSFNPSLLTLRVINMFDIPELETPQVNSIDFSSIPLWSKILGSIGKQMKPF